MDSEEDEILSTRPGTGTTGDSTKAAKPSPDSTEPSSPRRGSKRRVTAAVTSADPRSVTEGPLRVLRARGAGAARITESVNATCKKKTTSMHRGRGRPALSRSKNTPVMQ